jgi:class 3 adenylate cyclase
LANDATIDTEATASARFGKLLYPMRVLAMLGCALIVFLHVWGSEPLRAHHVAFLALVLSYPHVSHVLYRRLDSSRTVELGTTVVDAFVGGLTSYLAGFAMMPTVALVTIPLANGLGLNGPPLMALAAVGLLAGVSVPTALLGPHNDPRDIPAVNLASAVFLFAYFNAFAYAVWRRTFALQSSRKALRLQKTAIEIEKTKSDRLLLGILPAPVAAEMERFGAVAARRHESVSLLVVGFDGFSRHVAELAPDLLLDEINHLFKAFDAIVARHRLEPLRSVGDCYVAAGGLPVPSETHASDAVRAAIEIRSFLRDLAAARTAAGRPAFAGRIAVHTGPLVAGLVESAKFTYDVWGDAVEIATLIARQAPPGEVALSATAWAMVHGEHPARAGASVTTERGESMAFHVIGA